MEEEINYSSVVFRNGGRAPKDNKEEPTVYAEVKPKGPAAGEPNGEAAAARAHRRVLAVGLGILGVLLVASISVIIYISLVMNEQKANLSNVTAENQRLIVERSVMERDSEELSRVADNLNRTLGIILRFDTFPVNEYCPEKKCQPCRSKWIQFQEKCYLFYDKPPPWKTWQQSQQYCQKAHADLVVVGSLQEQEFISNNTKYYFDHAHGYWMGLFLNDDRNWVWVDGSNATLGYWALEDIGTPGAHGLMIPELNFKANWDPADNKMLNKFICESDALIWTK